MIVSSSWYRDGTGCFELCIALQALLRRRQTTEKEIPIKMYLMVAGERHIEYPQRKRKALFIRPCCVTELS